MEDYLLSDDLPNMANAQQAMLEDPNKTFPVRKETEGWRVVKTYVNGTETPRKDQVDVIFMSVELPSSRSYQLN